MSKTMSPSDLKALLAAEKADALAAASAAKLSADRADAMDYYLGDMARHMPARDGRSTAVSTDVADTIEGLMPSLMEIFAGSDEVVPLRAGRQGGRRRRRAGDRLRQPCLHAEESGLPRALRLHQGCAAVQGRHRQGVVGGEGAGRARDLSRPAGRDLRDAGGGPRDRGGRAHPHVRDADGDRDRSRTSRRGSCTTSPSSPGAAMRARGSRACRPRSSGSPATPARSATPTIASTRS